MITRRRDVAEKQVWDAGGEGKNVWDVGMSIIKTMGGGRQVKKVKMVKNSSGRREAGGRVKMALGGGMQGKNEAGGGMLHPCVPPCYRGLYGLLGITRDYWGLQGITGDYRGL